MYELIDKYARVQEGLTMNHIYPNYEDGLCSCGCGRPLRGRRTRWATDQCKTNAVDRFLVTKGDTEAIRRLVWERDQGVCALCGEVDPEWQAHHVRPVSLGGGGCGLDNFATLCLKCHKEVHKKKGDDQILPLNHQGLIFF